MNSFGRIFRVSIYGESHGSGVGIVIDGCLPGISLTIDDFMPDILRRKPGMPGSTPRIEEDMPEILSGVFQQKTTGAPIHVFFQNKNTRSADYDAIKNTPRPGHADWVLQQKFSGYNDYRGGGHASGRLTLALVAAGVIAKKLIPEIAIHAFLEEAGGSTDIEAAIQKAIDTQDSIGGIVRCTAKNMPVGWGSPFFDSVESLLSHALFSIPAIKGVAFGSGFQAAKMTGSTHNDPIIDASGKTPTNHAGGINGGITNGNDLDFRVAVKPTSSTPQVQHTWNQETQSVQPFTVKGRHDLCIALRVPVVVEAVTAIVFADLKLQHQAEK
jgi:chorismate synthase